jgi:hypothetical protein
MHGVWSCLTAASGSTALGPAQFQASADFVSSPLLLPGTGIQRHITLLRHHARCGIELRGFDILTVISTVPSQNPLSLICPVAAMVVGLAKQWKSEKKSQVAKSF